MRSTELRQLLLEEMQIATALKQENRLRALQSVHALVSRAERKKKRDLSSESTLKLLFKTIKTKKAAIKTYTSQGRTVLAKLESEELAIVNKYLPKQLTEDEICHVIDEIIAKVSAQDAADRLKMNRLAIEAIGAGAERKVVVRLVRQRLMT